VSEFGPATGWRGRLSIGRQGRWLALGGLAGLAGHISLTLVTRVVMVAAGVVTSVVTAHALGPADRGVYFYVVTMGMLAVQFGNLGLGSTNALMVARNEARLPALAANSLWVAIVLGGAACAIVAVFESVTGGAGRLPILAVLLLFVPSTLYGLLGSNLLAGLSRFPAYNAYMLFSTGGQLVAIVVSALLTRDVATILWANSVAVLLGSAGLWLVLRRAAPGRLRFDWKEFRSGMGLSGRIYAITALGYFVSRTNVVLLDRIAGDTQVGLYSIAVQFSDALLILPATAATVLLPGLVRSSNASAFVKTLWMAAASALLMGLACLVVALGADLFVLKLFGPKFAESASVLRWMLPGTFALSIATMISQYLSVNGVPLVQILVWAVALVAIIAVGFLAIPIWGAKGAAIGLSVIYAGLTLGLAILLLSHRRATAHAETTRDNV
jgi:O-antigen/teichoic acid export membrane protein